MKTQHPDDATLMEVAGGNASAALFTAVRAHAQDCAPCARRLDGFHAVLDVARDNDTVDDVAYARAKSRLMHAIGQEAVLGRRPQGLWGSKVAAGVMLVAFSGAALALGATAASSDWFSRPALTPSPVVAPSPSPRPVPKAPEAPPHEADATDVEDSDAVVIAPVETAAASKPAASVTAPPAPKRRVASSTISVPKSPLLERQPVEFIDEKSHPEPHRKVALATGAKSVLATATAAEAAARTKAAGAEEWIGVGDLYAHAGEAEKAGESFLSALKGPAAKTARKRLGKVANADRAAATRLLTTMREHFGPQSTAEEMRLQCEWGLRFRGDRRAVEDCQAFGRHHPEHSAMRTLALAAGETAERRLGDCPLAIVEYSRALVLGQASGMTSAGALASRARCREAIGDV